MQIPGLTLALDRLPAPLPIWRGRVDADAWQAPPAPWPRATGV